MSLALMEADARKAPFAHTTHAAPLPVDLCEAALGWMETTPRQCPAEADRTDSAQDGPRADDPCSQRSSAEGRDP
jgi:hypothetical protein